MVSPAFPGLFFAFAGMVLLLFASVSAPVWERPSFLNVVTNQGKIVFGVFGECITGGACTKARIGYNLTAPGTTGVEINSSVLHRLTYILILHPIGGAIALISFLFGLCGIAFASRACTIIMAATSFLAALTALFVFVIDMVLWNLVKQRLHDAGYEASLGIANWFTVGAVVALWLAFCTSICGAFGRFASGRAAGEKY